MATVAARAGVHTTTVSLALRNHPSLPLETRERLQALAAEMGYRRDAALNALVAYRRQSPPTKGNPPLAYVTNWESRWGWKEHPVHQRFFEGAQRKAAEFGHRLEHIWLREDGTSPRGISQSLSARGITGIILASHDEAADAPVDFEWSKFCAVKIDSAPRSQPLHMVTNDQRTIVALAMQRVMAAGYRRIGFVMPLWWDPFVQRAWSAGFLGEQQLLDVSDQIPILHFSTPLAARRPAPVIDQAAPRQQLSAWLRTYRPDVIISCGSFIKFSLEELGVSIPGQLAFVDTFLVQPDGSTAGVQQNCHRVGELAVEAVDAQLQKHSTGIPAVPTATLVEGTWHDGASLPLRRGAKAGHTPTPVSLARVNRRRVTV